MTCFDYVAVVFWAPPKPVEQEVEEDPVGRHPAFPWRSQETGETSQEVSAPILVKNPLVECILGDVLDLLVEDQVDRQMVVARVEVELEVADQACQHHPLPYLGLDGTNLDHHHCHLVVVQRTDGPVHPESLGHQIPLQWMTHRPS